MKFRVLEVTVAATSYREMQGYYRAEYLSESGTWLQAGSGSGIHWDKQKALNDMKEASKHIEWYKNTEVEVIAETEIKE